MGNKRKPSTLSNMKGFDFMSNLITSGVQFSLVSANLYSKLAIKPITMASNELKKTKPDMDLVNRAMGYGTKELAKAGSAINNASEELTKAQENAKLEKEAEEEAQLNKSASDKGVNATTNSEADIAVDGSVPLDSSSPRINNEDSLEISADALIQMANTPMPKVAIDDPKIYKPDGVVVLDVTPKALKLNVRV